MAEDIGYIDLTLYQSGTAIKVKAAHISMFYRKTDSSSTTVHLQGALEFVNAKETPDEIVAKIRDINPELR